MEGGGRQVEGDESIDEPACSFFPIQELFRIFKDGNPTCHIWLDNEYRGIHVTNISYNTNKNLLNRRGVSISTALCFFAFQLKMLKILKLVVLKVILISFLHSELQTG